MAFTKAVKEQGRLRFGISSPAGFGKTFTALRIARRLAQHYGGRVALIDTEHGSASKYADEFDFDADQLVPPFAPARYVQKIREAEAAGYKVLVIDSASHEWSGAGGCLEMVDVAARAGFKGNKWAAWSDVTPEHDKFINALLTSGMHIIATFRSKTETAQTGEAGNRKVEKLGMQTIGREGTEYEFDIMGELDSRHRMMITKTRCKVLTDREFTLPGEDVADILIAWLSDGAPIEPKAAKAPEPRPAPVEAQAAPPEPAPAPDELPQGNPAHAAKWFARQVALQGKLTWPEEARMKNAQALAIDLDKRGLNAADRHDAYLWLTAEDSGKSMSAAQLCVLAANSHRVEALRECAAAWQEQQGNAVVEG